MQKRFKKLIGSEGKLMIVVPGVVLVVALLIFWFAFNNSNKAAKVSAVPITECEGANSQQFKCWRDRYQQMVAQQSPKVALADADQEYKTNAYFKSNCHQIVHVIGRAAGKKYKDVAEAYKQGGDLCWSGYYHGVLEAVADRIGPEQLVAQINSICASLKKESLYKFAHYNCVHGLGHGLMAVLNNDLFKSLTSCDNLNDQWERSSCYSGVYMENVMSEINPDHRTQYLKADDLLYPCTAVDEKYKSQCYLMQTSHALKETNYDFAAIFSLCDSVAEPHRQTCFQSLGRDASGSTISDAQRTKAICLLGTTDAAQENCFVGAVKDFISYYHSDQQARGLCAILDSTKLQNLCTSTTKSYYATF